ncbi:hypothetical protein Tco_0482821, partial [Tanacetum coccineum]
RFLNETAPQMEPPKEGKLSNAQAMQAVETWNKTRVHCSLFTLAKWYCRKEEPHLERNGYCHVD